MGDGISDLFGNPVRANKGERGRPVFEVTERNRNKVKLLLAMGWSNPRIANAIACSLATLKRYFRAELAARDQMRDRLDAERLMLVAERAADGVIGAHRVLENMIEKNDQRLAEAVATRPAKAESPVGKKQARAQIAQDADADLMALLESEVRGESRH